VERKSFAKQNNVIRYATTPNLQDNLYKEELTEEICDVKKQSLHQGLL
jgi:hypothetical protein